MALKYNKGQCCMCPEGHEDYIVKKLPSGNYCNKHNKERLGQGKVVTYKNPKKRKITGELAFFETIWAMRPHVSEVSGQRIPEFDIRCFSHILTKGAYPKFRLYDKNIKLVTPQEHFKWEFEAHKLKDDPQWDWVFERKAELKAKYYQDK